jgi:C1A family cysteine protease
MATSTSTKRSTPNQQRSIIFNCQPSRQRENDWSFEAALGAGVAAPGKIPPAVDLRAKWWAVNDQGETGSCVGWASADSVLRWHMVKAKKLTQKEMLSVRFIWMASKETDIYTSYPSTFIEEEGTSLKAALDIARKFGIVTESVLPFGTGALYGGKAQTLFAMAAQRKINSYYNLGTKIADWRRWIATKGPILTRLDCDSKFMNASDTAGKLDVYDPASADGGHAVSLVGYTLKHFIVRNSWGTSWGDGGFAYASNEYAAAAFTEAYGVSV